MPGFQRTVLFLAWVWAAIFLIMTLSYVVRPFAWSVPLSWLLAQPSIICIWGICEHAFHHGSLYAFRV